MTKTPRPPAHAGIALALQGGAAHGAFTWGATDRLLEAGIVPDRICGVSAGAILGAMLVQGMVQDGPRGARSAMRRLWEKIAAAGAMSPLRSSPLERWLYGHDLSNSFAWAGIEATMRMFSPHQLNPLGHNPLRELLAELLVPELLSDPAAIRLHIGVTDVETGAAVIFQNEAITIDVLLASTCLPFVFPAVEIAGRAYWDGGYSGNPPLAPLLTPPPSELWVLRGQPERRSGVPRTPSEIINRLNEIACHTVLATELAAVPPGIRIRSIDADPTLAVLPISTKFNTELDFLTELFEAGRAAAGTVLLENTAPAEIGGEP